MATKLVTDYHKVHVARQLLESITETANNAYYLFMGHHMPRETDLPEIDVTQKIIVTDTYRNMLYGKRITSSDVNLMIRNIPYTSNTVYDMFDDEDDDLDEKDFYAVVNAGAYYHVFKVLDNNNDSPSTVTPDFAHISGSNTSVYETADGYRWKYMYSVDSTTKGRFATSDYFPVVPNTDVQDSAVDGSIDIIKVEDGGERYDNYLTGTFTTADIRVSGNATLYAISNTVASTVNGYYTGCLLYLSTGGASGQHKSIIDYFSNANGNFIVIDSAFDETPVNGTGYQINPGIVVVGNGFQTVNAVARGMVNALASNSIFRVEVLERGAGYQTATAYAVANSVVGITTEARIRPIMSPPGGHGADPAEELRSTNFCLSVKVNSYEQNTIPVTNDFQSIGIIKDPLFANVQLTFDSINGTFANGETIYKIKPVRLATNVSINTTSDIIQSPVGDFAEQLSPGDYVYITSGTSHQLTTVNAITNSSYLTIASNGFFTANEASIYAANISSFATITRIISGNTILVTNLSGVISSEDKIIGVTSGAVAVIDDVIRNGVTKGFDTFVQMYKYIGSAVSGELIEDEIVYQTSLDTANACLHSVETDSGVLTIYTSNQMGQFTINSTSNTIVGNTSSAIVQLSDKYSPELVYGSGKVLYLENVYAVTREIDQSEVFRIIFSF